MANTVTFGRTTKPINSTSRIMYAGGDYTADCKLKEPCSMQAPVFILDGLPKNKMFNYAKWVTSDDDMVPNRYYWIDDIAFITNNIVEVHCHLDPLATFREYIKDNEYYVVYGDSSHWNEWIDDCRMQPEVQLPGYLGSTIFPFADTESEAGTANPTVHIDEDGCVVFRVMEATSYHDVNTMGQAVSPPILADQIEITWHQGVNTYVCSPESFLGAIRELSGEAKELFDVVFSGQAPGNKPGWYMAQGAAKLWGNLCGAGDWSSNLIYAVYLPFRLSDMIQFTAHQCSFFALGGVPCGGTFEQFQFYRFDTPIKVVNYFTKVAIPWSHVTAKPSESDPHTNKYSFLRNPRWCALQVNTPGGYGMIDLADLKEQEYLGVVSSLDLMTGEWSIKILEQLPNSLISYDQNQTLATFGGCFAVDLMSFMERSPSAADMIWNAGQKVADVIASIKLKTNVNAASETLSVYQADPRNFQDTTSASVRNHQRAIENYYGNVKNEQIYSGIAGEFAPTGIVGASAPAASMSGSLNSAYLTRNLGAMYIYMIQYVPKDFYTGNNYSATDKYHQYCDKHGYPVNAWLNLKDENVTGYVQCAGAYLDYCPGATKANLSTINAYLNNGIYIEE